MRAIPNLRKKYSKTFDLGRSPKVGKMRAIPTLQKKYLENKETVALCVIKCPRPFFPTHILKLLTWNQTYIWHEKNRSKVIRCTFLGHNSIQQVDSYWGMMEAVIVRDSFTDLFKTLYHVMICQNKVYVAPYSAGNLHLQAQPICMVYQGMIKAVIVIDSLVDPNFQYTHSS